MSHFLKNIFVIAKITILELFYARVILAFCLLFTFSVGACSFLEYFSPEEQIKFTQDIGITSFAFFSLLIVFFGVTAVFPNQNDHRKDLFLMTKPLRKIELLLGRVAALEMVLGFVFLAMAFFLGVVLYFRFQSLNPQFFSVLYLLMLKYGTFLYLIIFFATFMNRLMVIILGILMFLLANSLVFLETISLQISGSFQLVVIKVFKLFLPRFDLFNLTHTLLLDQSISNLYLWQVTGYAIVYGTVLFLLAALIHSRREF